MGSPSDQVGTNTEVASVIREFTEPVMEDENNYGEQNSESDSVRFKPPPHPLVALFILVYFFIHVKPSIGILHNILSGTLDTVIFNVIWILMARNLLQFKDAKYERRKEHAPNT